MKVCRICLSKAGRLYHITGNGLRSLYYQLTGFAKLEMDVDKRLPQWVCAECGLRLMSYHKLRQKSLRSYNILCQILNKGDYITEEFINQIDRVKYELTSNLSPGVLDIGTNLDHEDYIRGLNNKGELETETTELETEASELETEAPEFIKLEKDVDSSSKYISEEIPMDVMNTSDDPLSEADSCNLENDELLSNFSSAKSKKNKKNVGKNYKCTDVIKIKKNLDKKYKCTDEFKIKKKRTRKVVKKRDVELEDLFTVRELSLEEQIAEIANRQHNPSYINAPYKCDDCYVGFLSEDVYGRHLKRHTDVSGILSCELCKKRFTTNARLNTHIKSHKVIYSCKQCSFTARARCLAVQHGLRHKGHQYQCAHCGVNFDNSSSYYFHLKIKHVSTNFVCEYCGFAFLSAKGVVQHKSLVHGIHSDSKLESVEGPTCPTCNIKFASDEALARHEGISHSQTPEKQGRNELLRVYKCELCGSKVRDRRAFEAHYLTHLDDTSTEVVPAIISDTESAIEDKQNKHETENKLKNEESNLENDKLECNRKRTTTLRQKGRKKAIVTKVVIEKSAHSQTEDDLFTLQILSMDEQITEMTNRQHSPSYIDAPYKCIDCYIGFLNEHVLERHRLRHSDDCGRFVCNLCKRRFPSKARHSSHMKTHKTMYKCKLCNFTARESYKLMDHRLKHNGHAYECPHCGKKLQNRSSYFLHLKVKHVERSHFVCQYCGFAFMSAKGVTQHKNLVHGINRHKETEPLDGPTCSTCNIKFASDEALAKHEDISHPQIPGEHSRNAEVRRYFCKICGLRTNDCKAFKIHCRNHTENADNIPTKCATNVTSTLRTDKPAVCIPCGREFKNEITLAKHAVVHSGIKPHQCDECGRKFAVKKACKIHIMKVHAPRRPRPPKPQSQSEAKYLCSVCGKEFATLGNMTIHSARHSEQRPFACEVCGKQFKTNSEVDSHTLHVHLKKPWPRTKRARNTL